MAPRRVQSPPPPPLLNVTEFANQLVTAVCDVGSSTCAPDLMSTLKEFSGSISTTEAKEWLRNLESQSEINRWSDRVRLEAARRKLTGGARSWFLMNAEDIKTWAQFRTAFTKTFVGELSPIEKWQKFSTRAQRDSEPVIDYIFDKLRLAKDVGLSVSEAKSALCAGFKSTELGNYLQMRDYSDTDQVLAYLREHENFQTERANLESANRKSNAREGGKSFPPHQSKDQQPKVSDSEQSKQPRSDKSTTRCYNCNEFAGHLSRDCPKERRPKWCSICRTQGHSRKECPSPTAAQGTSTAPTTTVPEKKTVSAVSVPTSTDNAEKYFKDAYVNGKLIPNAMVDPGSKVCLARASTAISLQEPITPIDARIFGVGSLDIGSKVLGSFTAAISIDGVVVDGIPVLVVPDAVIPATFMIGQTWTEHPDVAFVKLRDQLIIGRASDAPFAEFPVAKKSVPSRGKLRAAESAILKPNIVSFVRVSTGLGSHERAVDVISARLSLYVDSQSFVPLVSDWEMVLKKGDRIARFCEIDIESAKSLPSPNHIVASVNTAQLYKPLSFSNFIFSDNLSPDVCNKFLCVLNRYRKGFACNVFELGDAKVPAIEVIEKPNSHPVASKPYRSNQQDAAELTRLLTEWRAAGLVVDTSSNYAAPAFLVGKKDGSKRPVFDFRRLNAQTQKVHFPLPNIDDHLAALSRAKYFTVLDLASGYLQIPLSPELQAKTAFVTPNETGQFTRLPYGLCNAPAEFSRIMSRVLGSMRNRIVFNYLDDILIPAETIEEMLERLESVLQALTNANLACRPEKCIIAADSIEFLGFEISAGSLRPGKRKVDAIASFPVPKNVHDIRRFIGLSSFFRRFIRNFAIRISPLSELTKKDCPFLWGEREEGVFNDIRASLICSPVLGLYNPIAETELHTDASQHGIAGMLFQRSKPGEAFRLIYAVSKKTTGHECQYHSSKLELLAIVWSVARLRQFLLGIRFTIVTDCQALLHMNAQKTANSQIARWSLALQEYDYVVHHRKGEQMQHVDALSRAPVGSPDDTEEQVNAQLGVFTLLAEIDVVRMYQRRDANIRTIIDHIDQHPEFVVRDGLLYRKDTETGRELFVAPKSMRKSLCIRHHDLLGRYSTEKVVASIKRKYWFAGMRRYICCHIRSCIDCLLAKGDSGKRPGLLSPIPPGKRPFKTVHIDHLGPFVETSEKNNYILVLVDNLTKFVRLWAVPDTTSDAVERCLNEFISNYGLPDRIVSDRGTCFPYAQFVNYCKVRGTIAHHVATRILNAQLTIYAASSFEETEDWDRFLPDIQRNINVAVNRSTGRSPFELLHGYFPRFIESTLDRVTHKSESTQDLDIMRHIALEHIATSQAKMKEVFDRRHCAGDRLEVGEIVFIKCPSTTKLQPKYRGPMVVVQNVAGDIYRLQDLRREGSTQGLVDLHISQIRPWRSADFEDESPTEESESEMLTEDDQQGRMAECGE